MVIPVVCAMQQTVTACTQKLDQKIVSKLPFAQPLLQHAVCTNSTGYHLELRHELPDKVAIGIILAPKGDRAVHSVILIEESAGRKPHPVCVVQAPVIVYQQPVEDISACRPGAI